MNYQRCLVVKNAVDSSVLKNHKPGNSLRVHFLLQFLQLQAKNFYQSILGCSQKFIKKPLGFVLLGWAVPGLRPPRGSNPHNIRILITNLKLRSHIAAAHRADPTPSQP
jgi:hypothetical protein